MGSVLVYPSVPASSGSANTSGGSKTWLLRLAAWALLAGALLVVLYRTIRFGGYFPDDAYITFRFARHLSEGHGIVWNIGGPPVEGSTSFLLTLLTAGAYNLGLSVPMSVLVFALLSAGLLLFLLFLAIRHLCGALSASAALPLAVYLAGVQFSVHVNSGMETVLFTTLLMASFVTSLTLIRRPEWLTAIGLALINFLALWCRPDAAPFLFGQGLVLMAVALFAMGTDGERRLLGRLVASYIILIVLGVAFLLWKLSYFGYILPNSFYVKSTSASELSGLPPVLEFLSDLGLRLALFVPLLLFVDWKGLVERRGPQLVARIALLVVPVTVFLAYNITTLHIVGFFSRFEFPMAVFFWVGVAWFLGNGRPLERLADFLTTFAGAIAGTLAAAAVAFAVLGAVLVQDRSQHQKWFSWMQILHYQPVANALRRSGAGHEGTIVFDSAGFIPFSSGFSLLDPIGLTDNVLSGRDPITALEREEYMWGSNPDVYLGPVPPATPGAETGAEDPLIDSTYIQSVLLRQVPFQEYARIVRDMTYEEQRDVLHYRMRELRDNWVAIGEIPYPFPGDEAYTHFLYVREASPHAAALIEELEKITTRELSEIDFDDLLDGQKPHDLASVSALEP